MLTLLGIIVGASLQHFFSRLNEQRKQTDQLRTQAYVDFLSGVSRLARHRSQSSADREQLLAQTADAKARICLYGTDAVVRQLANFSAGGAVLDNPNSQALFLEVCTTMRAESRGKVAADLEDGLRLVLFGPSSFTPSAPSERTLSPRKRV